MIVKVGLSEGDFVGNTNVAIQRAIDAVGLYGGGTVEVAPGSYTLYDSVLLRRNVRLVGSGPDTILRKCEGPASEFAVDADYGQRKVTVKDPTGFREGMGVVVTDDRSGGWHDTLAAITLVQGNVLYLDRPFLSDYDGDSAGIVFNSFPIVAGFDVDAVTVEGLTIDGDREHNREINGCIGGGIYLHRARRCRIADCIVRDFAGDGISFQITQDILVEGCQVTGVTGLGLHPGTGSARPAIRGCRSHDNGGDGFFLCWRVQVGSFQNNEFFNNGGHGISIGHKDTDNLFSENVIRGNRRHGVYFRDEKTTNAGSRNTLRRNIIEDNEDCGVYIEGHTTDLLLEENTIRDTRRGEARTQRIGIRAGQNAGRIRAVRNRIENHVETAVHGEVAVED
ncbi:MAG: right-handed parallel beta-helix repeat-containing protein [Armatimonadota bacterium]|nr:MAG: right-handed parallel beta-helix repeat-containing protein [Armatimonadota bacterium]